jgi:NSS family neurotransmitter:Na+ symporter
MKRDQWGNRTAFVLAAIGSAAGLGNAWRFPYITYANGGGAFLIPYFVALLTAGIPLLILEFGLGQQTQLGAPGAMGKVKKKFETFGWWPVLAAFFIVSYYTGVLGWIWNYIKDSFTLKWAGDAQSYFYGNVLQITDGPGILGGISWPVLIGVILSWIIMYYILRKGTESVGKVIWFTVMAPVILLLILIIRSVTLPGAIEGLNYFLKPDFSKLLEPQVWIDAYSQIFFTLSLGMGIMIAYASYMPEDSDITNNALITVFANSGVSFMAGIAVFGTLGYMAQAQGVPVSDVVASGPGLAFVVYPNAINMLPGGSLVVGFFGLVFFLTLITLGIDSAFSLVESVVAGVVDKWNLNKQKTTFWVIIALFITSILFTTKAGLYWLDIVDHYVLTYGLLIAGVAECLVIGWSYKPETLRSYINEVSEYRLGSWWNLFIKYLTPIFLIILIYSNLIKEPYGGYEGLYLFLGGWGLLIVMAIISFILASIQKKEAVSLDAE